MQDSKQITNDQVTREQSEKKAYATPHLTRHGKIEEITQQSQPPTNFSNAD